MSNISTPLSDLFFNSSLDAFNELGTDDALYEDAKEFSSLIEDAFSVTIDPKDLVEDFLERVQCANLN